MWNKVFLRGISLIEVLVFIVVISISVTGVLVAYDRAVRGSSDPIERKQAIAIAEALLDEIELQPFTYCDPDDSAATTATSTSSCTTVEASGPETGETRYSDSTPFDNVNDYDGFTTISTGMRDILNNAISALNGYSASVTVTNSALGSISSTESLLISVAITTPSNQTLTLEGYRTRYAPTSVP